MADRGGFALAPEFWSSFAARHWEREPGVFRGVLPGPVLAPEQTFRAFVAAFDGFRRGGAGDRPRCYVEGAEVTDGAVYARFVPRPEDESLQAYARRVSASLSGRRFGVVINSFHLQERELWYRLRGLLRGLFAITGLPAARTDPVLFFGDYPFTPFGVHTDRAHVFTFALGGAKRILLWPRRYFAERQVPRLEDRLLVPPAPYEKDALELRIGPADLMYWPPSHWHVGAAEPGEPHASLGVGVYVESTTTAMLGAVLPQAWGEAALASLPSGAALPPALETALQATERASSSGRARRFLTAEWLRRVTSDGFQPPPDPLPARVDDEDRLQLGDGGPLFWAELEDGLLVAGNGHSWFNEWPAALRAELIAAFTALNAGELVRVSKLARLGPVLPLLMALVGAEALRVYQHRP